MGRAKSLSEDEGSRIMAYLEIGYNPNHIATILGRSRHAITNHINKVVGGVQKRRTGRPKVTTLGGDRRIIRRASNSASSSERIRSDLDLSCSSRTIRRRIKELGILKYRKMSRKPVLKAHEKARRVDWARARLHWQTRWKKIVFSDEKRFCLDGPDGNRSYYHDVRKPELICNRRHSGGGGVMIWGAIGWHGKSTIAFVDTTMNSEKYIEVLTNHLLPHGARIGGDHWIFMQDNAPVHTSQATKAFLNQQNVRLLSWPPRSPDMNPIENLWSQLSRIVYADGKQFSTIPELREAILAGWAAISRENIHPLYVSMPSRLQEVVNKKGYIAHY